MPLLLTLGSACGWGLTVQAGFVRKTVNSTKIRHRSFKAISSASCVVTPTLVQNSCPLNAWQFTITSSLGPKNSSFAFRDLSVLIVEALQSSFGGVWQCFILDEVLKSRRPQGCDFRRPKCPTRSSSSGTTSLTLLPVSFVRTAARKSACRSNLFESS